MEISEAGGLFGVCLLACLGPVAGRGVIAYTSAAVMTPGAEDRAEQEQASRGPRFREMREGARAGGALGLSLLLHGLIALVTAQMVLWTHLDALLRAYERFPEIGGRSTP